MLELRQVNIKFTEPVIEDGSLLIPDGELTALTGPSGSGKTTLLYCVGLVSSCKDYEYVFDGKQVDLSSEEEKGNLRKTKIGYIFQENNLNQNLTAGENVRLSASLAGADTGFSKIAELLEQVGLSGQGNSYPASLSGGEQQRLAIACALAKEPELIIADEPTSSLDEENTEQVLKLLEGIAAEGKKVVVASHSKAVVERCGVIYNIEEKKPVLVKGQEYIEGREKEERVERETEKKKRKLRLPFYLRYQRKNGRKGQVLKELTVGICALSVAFTALSTGYVKDFEEQQKQYFQAISERELIVTKRMNPTVPETGYLTDIITSLSEEEILQLQGLGNVEKGAPLIMFNNHANIKEGGTKVDYSQVGFFDTYISYHNRVGKSGKTGYCGMMGENHQTGETTSMGEGTIPHGYSVLSYLAYESMDLRCQWIDQSVAPGEGLYLPARMADEMGIVKGDLNGLELTIDVAVPAARYADIYQHKNDINVATDWCVETQITLPVRGVLAWDIPGNARICAPSSVMMKCIEENQVKVEKVKENLSSEWGLNTSGVDFHPWRPWAYYLMVDDVANIDAVKKAVAEIAPDLDVIHEYQDYQAVMESVDNSQKMVLYVSLAILAVILCLSAIVYVNIIDKRKYEIAMLRANGLTKGEIRKLVMSEMGVQAVITFVVSLLLAWAGYEVLSRTVGGFTFNWLTVMWLGIISVISVILPSGVALVLTNRYEPDQILRN